MTRIVALDVDGTLVDPGGHLPPARAGALAALQRGGIRIALASGRGWRSMNPLADRLGLPGPHVCCNGAAVVHEGRPRIQWPMDPDVAAQLQQALIERDIAHCLYVDDGELVTSRWQAGLADLVALGEIPPVVGEVGDRPVIKVLAVATREEEGDLRSVAADRVLSARTGRQFLEWQAPSVSKAHGLGHLIAELGLGWEDVVAVGDAENDVAMISRAGLGVAVGHAASAAVAAADLHLAERDLTDFLRSLPDDGGRTDGGARWV